MSAFQTKTSTKIGLAAITGDFGELKTVVIYSRKNVLYMTYLPMSHILHVSADKR